MALVTPKSPHNLKMAEIVRPNNQGSNHTSTIAFKIMKIFSDGREKEYLGATSHCSYISGGPAIDGKPRPDSEPHALHGFTKSEDPAKEGAKEGSLLKQAIDNVLPKLDADSHLRVKFYIKNSAFPPCKTPKGQGKWSGGPIEERPGIPCDTYLPMVLDTLSTQYPGTEFRMKVDDPKYTTRYGYGYRDSWESEEGYRSQQNIVRTKDGRRGIGEEKWKKV